ncbi:trafficking kinesin-binding protein 2 isoform X7 [Dermochelys coriacea]|uniref:trafficking kinesin-binding protein 2 isoform X7 n=1 Tax=Dermochelys coriacea TaxID=27794 RepID=UPI001CA9A03B|nr:trafficking kinesin-binding protein 2 isoform X7 [Dermochelys coriacea]XP_043361525.1 trafficking kinesin-binding protein 2 isoform X7 [Dermochelys coriacea]
MNINHGDPEIITDGCSSEDLPEVELMNMLEEQLPQYKLRVDTLYPYDNQDWLQAPSCYSHVPQTISPVLAEETFRYMILGTDRVEQMTKTYNDIDMVTHLLAERDRDLELAARIGQALLKRNHVLTEQNEVLEEQLGQAFDQVNQLQHELSKKDELLRIVSIASEESETDSSSSTPLRFNDSFNLSHGLLQLDVLQDKLREMEEENLALRSKACHLKTETITYEVKEQELVSDCVRELRETHAQIARMTEELSGKSEELIHYQEEISTLLSQMVDLQHKLKEHVIEKEELKLHLQASKDAQRQLTGELHELQDRNAECLGLWHELQEEVRKLRSRASPAAHLCRPQSCGAFPLDSLAAEIEGTMRMELIQDEESALGKQKDNQKLGQPGTPGDNDLATALHTLCLRQQNYLSEKQFFEEQWERKMHLLADQKEEAGGCCTPVGSCLSGGANSEFTDFSGGSPYLRLLLPEKLQIVKPLKGSQTLFHWQQLAQPNLGTILDPRPGVVTKGFTPLPEDAVYHISDLEEDEEEGEGGITFQVPQAFLEEGTRAVPKPEAGIFLPPITSAAVPLTASNPGKCLPSTNSTFTFTTCRILHPSDVTQVTPSSMYTPLSFGSSGNSTGNTTVSSPAMSCRLSIGEFLSNRRDSSTTLSTTTSLAKLLHEQGISACDNPMPGKLPMLQPLRTLPILSTPRNSPSCSPCSSPLPFDTRAHLSENFLASRPTETFLQERFGLKPSHNPPNLDQLKMNLVDRLKRLGIARAVKPPEAGDHVKNQGPEIGLRRQDSAVFLSAGSNLMGGLRRNQSLPVMIGALGAPFCTSSSKMGILKKD